MNQLDDRLRNASAAIRAAAGQAAPRPITKEATAMWKKPAMAFGGALIGVALVVGGAALLRPAPPEPPAAATTTTRTDSFGPLAVRASAPGGDDAMWGPGRVVIAARCVSLVNENGSEAVPAWKADEVTWDAETETITYAHPDSDPIVIRAGDTIILGGSSLEDDEDTVPIDRDIEWVAEPDPSCLGELFATDSVRLP